MCGGTSLGRATFGLDTGLSPRVRGNPFRHLERPHRQRSIPACAGEPRSSAAMLSSTRVYPRVCGGTRFTASRCSRRWGLSPRVRGNPARDPGSASRRRSIPACAGEPSACMQRQVRAAGLSPRVRGNPGAGGGCRRRHRSIPACAGEPAISPRSRTISKVYPRVCGGTRRSPPTIAVLFGLSPRVRGNPGTTAPTPPKARSIPACAGEPIQLSI